ncbi:hypothetical protein EV182_002594, partial [Spiromyces aspiralis]
YLIVAVLGISIYLKNHLGIDEDEFGGKMELFSDSFGPASAAFVVSWISWYTWIHG